MNCTRLLPIFHLIKKRLLLSHGIRNFSSAINHESNMGTHYTFRNVEISVPGGFLAGKLWEPKSSFHDASNIPPVICLHGFLDNAGSFDRILPMMMSQSTRYFCLDFPGHGITSYCPQWWYDLHTEGILSVRRVAKHFGWDKFSIFGHSLGGIVGFLYTAYFPDDVHKFLALETMKPLPLPNSVESNIDMFRTYVDIVLELEEQIKLPKKLFKYDEILDKLYERRQQTITKDGCNALLKRGANEVKPGQYQFTHDLRTYHILGHQGFMSQEMCLKMTKEISCPVCLGSGTDVGDVLVGGQNVHR